MLIGGFALGFHGAPRGTKDVDIVPDPSPAHIARLWDALQELGAEPSDHADFRPEEMPVAFTLDGLFEGGNWALETLFGHLDVMQRVAGVDNYEKLRARAVMDELPEIGDPIWIAGRDDLVTMKQEAGAPTGSHRYPGPVDGGGTGGVGGRRSRPGSGASCSRPAADRGPPYRGR